MTEKTTPEPVAYFAKRQYGGVDLWEQVHAKYAHMSDVVPLYAHPPAAPTPKPVAWLIRWTERDTPCSMLVDGDPGPAAEDETITPLYTHPDERVAALEAEIAKIKTENAQLKQMLFRAYDYVGVPDDKHAIWGPIRAVLIARTSK